MIDYLFAQMLNKRANLTRPRVAVDAEKLPREPEYELVQAQVPLRMRPARAALDGSLLGRLPEVSAVGYALPGDLREADRLGVVLAETSLAEAAEAEASSLSVVASADLQPGDRLHLRDGAGFAEAVVAAVEGQTVSLRDPLGVSLEEGAAVEVVESWEVQGVEDEAGAGHHLRLGLKRVESG